jgi:site-specific recombinase XerD
MLILTQAVLDKYIASKVNSWSHSTIRSERYRLKPLVGKNLDDPQGLYEELSKEYKPYSLQTLFIRINTLMNFLVRTSVVIENPYRVWIEENRNLFKNAYRNKEVSVTYNEAEELVKTLPARVRESAMSLLTGGLRAHELDNVKDGYIKGKGSKLRPLLTSVPADPAPYMELYKALKKVGLVPHDLRKLFITRLIERGIQLHDLCKVAGWNSIETAIRYAQPKKNEELRAFVKASLA